ncbi:hypothetical protein LLG95_12365 [bacterium]|nr:hypothetical protein [bacterium]
MKTENKSWKQPLTASGVLSMLLWILIFIIFLVLFSNYKSGATGSSGIIGTVSCVLLVAAVFWIAILVFYRTAMRREIAIINLLRDGEIDRFIAEMDKRLKKEKNARRRDIHKINKAAGLSNKGQWPEAISLLDEIEFQSLSPVHRMVYVNNRLFMLMVMGNLDVARQFREEYDSLLRESAYNTKLRDAVEGTLAVYDFYFGDIRQAEIKLNALLNNDIGPIGKAQHCFFLGLIAMQRGDDQSRDHFFKQAEDLGRNTYIPARIRDELMKLVR